MDVVDAWCKGGTFKQIVELTEVYEGSIIRAMRRLEELLRDMCHAAKGTLCCLQQKLTIISAIGNEELEAKFTQGIEKIKRDIVFAASLYL
jgi:ATP-dependent RNA helicase DOB1